MTLLGGALLALAIVGSALGYSNPVVDLSHWNGNVNLGKAKADGIAAVIHKATQGTSYVDPQYSSRRALAAKEGLLWGAYHFGIGGRSGAQQANYFLSKVGPSGNILLALDLEENHAGKSMSKGEADEFVRTIKASTGRYPVLYGSPYYLEAFDTPALRACKLWVAHYTAASSPRLPKTHNAWVLWQYTDGKIGGNPRTVNGIGPCDRDRYIGSVEQLKSKWHNL